MTIESWGKYPKIQQRGIPVSWQSQLESVSSIYSKQGYLPFGNGRSYGDVCLAESGVLLLSRGLDHFLSFDKTLGQIRVEAGVTIGDVLAQAVPAGWFLPVVPGTGLATIGGAIANDVHGKNHHLRGTFGRYVRRLWLWRGGQKIECSATLNSDIFEATIGGLGLTGLILEAELMLMPVCNGQIDTVTHRFNSLSEFFTLADFYDKSHEYGVAWIDCLSKGHTKGRGVYYAGHHAQYSSDIPAERSPFSLPVTPPVSLVNRLSLKLFNEYYWRTKSELPKPGRSAYGKYFFPLDAILNWNRIYGRRGFQQYQCVIPESCAIDAISDLLDVIAASHSGSFLAVMKKCGDVPSPGLLSFPMAGTSLALDFPNGARTTALFKRLDDITRSAGGRLYPAKDAHMTAKDFQLAYPAWEKLEYLRDPSVCSHFWRRVTS